MPGGSAIAAYEGRDDLKRYGSNGLILFALQMHLGVEDVDSVAATALTDGPNDKSCDLVYLDKATSTVVIAQGYMAEAAKQAAKSSKAADLNTAVSWLLHGELHEMPETLRSAAVEVRQALEQDDVRAIEIWYVHNCPESANVSTEMQQVAGTAKRLVSQEYASAAVTSIVGREVGGPTLDRWYQRTEVPIVVTERFEIPVENAFEQTGDKWSAVCTSVSGSWLRGVWKDHEADLLSPNVRDYLGLVRSEKNINYGIKNSAKNDPAEFWIFNNGLTVVVNDYELSVGGDGTQRLSVAGLGIVNGAHTAGTLGTLSEDESLGLDRLRVMVRFVKCGDPDVLRDIVRFNNTQNKVEAADFRSNDAVQDRLRKEFDSVPEAEYRGGRRGGVRDAIERKKNSMPNNAVAQALAAFHGRPNLAYNDTRLVWTEDGIYSQIFSDRTSARHIVLSYALLRAVEEVKQSIQAKPESDRTAIQRDAMDFFRRRGALHLLCAAIAGSVESIIEKAVPDRFGLRFNDNCSPREATDRWLPIVQMCLPFASNLKSACDRDLQNGEKVRTAIQTFAQFVAATASSNAASYAELAKVIEYVPPAS